jgi:ApbE superfamily uncharacterized protein (UPF0280 family)
VTEELPSLCSFSQLPVRGPVALRMADAVQPFRQACITPMAAVSGAVADELLTVMLDSTQLDRAFVNNGGDIALHLAAGQHFTMGMIDPFNRSGLPAKFDVGAARGRRGIATSRWSGPGHSLGIADAVTVCASVGRAPANTLDPRSDLGERLVTIRVGPLAAGEKQAALARGVALAEQFCTEGLIENAVLVLQDEVAMVRLDAVSRALVLG